MTTTTLPPGSHLDEAVRALAQRAPSWAAKEARELAALVRETRATTATVAAEWAETAALAKGLTLGTQPVSEEWQSGPWALLRHLRILESSLDTLAVGRKPRLPGTIRRNHMGRVVVPTYPIDRWDRILFPGIRAETWMQPGVAIDDVTRRQASAFDASAAAPGVALVLGAGNITSIGPMDALHKLFTDRVPAILKMSPVLDHLTHIMCHALRPLIEADGLRIVTGGSEAGSALTHDPRITQVHITGSDTTYEHVMFGTGEDGQPAKSNDGPILPKIVTAELGNVTPVIIVPGPWTERDLAYQSENLAVTLMHNAGFNCIATRLFVQHETWPQREAVRARIEGVMANTPPRDPYYPGAVDRYRLFSDTHPEATTCGPTTAVPWTMIPGLDPDADSEICFEREAFAAVTAEVGIPASNAAEFLAAAVEFCNERVWGTLGVSIFIHPETETDPLMVQALAHALREFRYGTIAVNCWSGLGYAMSSTPWGAYPGQTPYDIQSGVGFVHNALMLDGVEKTVVRAPWRSVPKPTWFPSHRSADRVLEASTFFEADPGLVGLARVVRAGMGA